MRLRTQAWLEIQVLVLEQEIEHRVISFEEPMARVMTIPGIDRKTVWMIVAELGVDTLAYVPYEQCLEMPHIWRVGQACVRAIGKAAANE